MITHFFDRICVDGIQFDSLLDRESGLPDVVSILYAGVSFKHVYKVSHNVHLLHIQSAILHPLYLCNIEVFDL